MSPVADNVPPELLHELLDHSPDLLAIAGPEGGFSWLSRSWERTLGWTREELMSRPFVEFVHPDDVERTIEQFTRMIERGEPAVSFENRYRHRDGGWRWLQWNSVVGTGLQLLSFARDVTERKEERLRDLERIRLLEMSEQLVGIAHWRLDLVAERLRWSTGVFHIHGMVPGDGEPTLEVAINSYHPDDRAMIERCVSDAIARQAGYEVSARLIRADGEIRHVESIGVPEVNLHGDVVAVFGVVRDITEDRRMEETIRRSERMVSVGTMAAGIAHEINNPLSYLMGNLQLVREELDRLEALLPPDRFSELDEMVDDSVAGAQRVRKIVNGMRALSRVGTSEATSVSVDDAIQAAISIAEHEVRLRARLEVEVEPMGSVFMDETQLVQVLVNVLVNAAQALPPGSSPDEHLVRVSAREEGTHAVISVSDTGPGIPPELRQRIFDPFFTTKPVGTGTGLGLSICHSILTHHGGTIDLAETAVGATFVIQLPLSESPDARAGEGRRRITSDASRSEERPRVLVVDDEEAVRALLSRALRREFDVTTSAGGSDAIGRLLREDLFDAVILDLVMPELSGHDVVEWMRVERPSLLCRTMIATGGSLTTDAESALERLAIPVLRKPFDIPDLRQELRRRVDAGRAESAAGRPPVSQDQ